MGLPAASQLGAHLFKSGCVAQVALVVRPGNKPLAETALQQYRVIESMEDLVSI